MIAKIIINRPEKRNALNSAVIHGIDEALKQAAEDPKVRVVILGGAGEKAFTAGFDLKEAMEHNITGVVERRKDTSEEIKFFMRMWNFPKPIVAAIQGSAIWSSLRKTPHLEILKLFWDTCRNFRWKYGKCRLTR